MQQLEGLLILLVLFKSSPFCTCSEVSLPSNRGREVPFPHGSQEVGKLMITMTLLLAPPPPGLLQPILREQSLGSSSNDHGSFRDKKVHSGLPSPASCLMQNIILSLQPGWNCQFPFHWLHKHFLHHRKNK